MRLRYHTGCALNRLIVNVRELRSLFEYYKLVMVLYKLELCKRTVTMYCMALWSYFRSNSPCARHRFVATTNRGDVVVATPVSSSGCLGCCGCWATMLRNHRVGAQLPVAPATFFLPFRHPPTAITDAAPKASRAASASNAVSATSGNMWRRNQDAQEATTEGSRGSKPPMNSTCGG